MKKLSVLLILVSALTTNAQEVLEKYECVKDNGEEMSIELKEGNDPNKLSFVFDNVHGYLDLSDPSTIYNEDEIYEEYQKKEGPYKNYWFPNILEYAEYDSFFKLDKNTLEGEYMSSQYIYPKNRVLRLLSKSKPYVREASFKCERTK